MKSFEEIKLDPHKQLGKPKTKNGKGKMFTDTPRHSIDAWSETEEAKRLPLTVLDEQRNSPLTERYQFLCYLHKEANYYLRSLFKNCLFTENKLSCIPKVRQS